MENKTGSFIAQRRKELGLTQKQLSEILGVTNKAVSKWETNQGLPDVGMLSELGKALGVTVDELLDGKKAEKPVMETVPYEGSLLDIAVERVERKVSGMSVKPRDIAGVLCFLLAAGLLAVQGWYLFIGRARGLVYLWNYIPAVMTGAAVLLLWIGGICMRSLRHIWKKGRVMAATAALLIVGIAVSMVFRQEGREILRLSPDASAVMRLNLEENGRAVLYRQRGVLFAAQSDIFPFTVKDGVKIQWLEDDVCAITYESPDDGGIHQYVATYGDRGGGISYYYVFNAVHGEWEAEDGRGNYAVGVTDGPGAGITVRTPGGTESYAAEECLQYGTLAIVFPRENPQWTLVLNSDCELDESGSGIKDGGTLKLCRVGMERTAPVTLEKAGIGNTTRLISEDIDSGETSLTDSY